MVITINLKNNRTEGAEHLKKLFKIYLKALFPKNLLGNYTGEKTERKIRT